MNLSIILSPCEIEGTEQTFVFSLLSLVQICGLIVGHWIILQICSHSLVRTFTSSSSVATPSIPVGFQIGNSLSSDLTLSFTTRVFVNMEYLQIKFIIV